jgi:hypothetical protein
MLNLEKTALSCRVNIISDFISVTDSKLIIVIMKLIELKQDLILQNLIK